MQRHHEIGLLEDLLAVEVEVGVALLQRVLAALAGLVAALLARRGGTG